MSDPGSRHEAAEPGAAVFAAPPDHRPQHGLLALLRGIDRLSYGVIVIVMALMSLILAAQVVARYGLGTSIDSANELSRLFFVWSIFLAIPHGIKYGVHVGIDVFVVMLPYRFQEILFRIIAAAGAVLMGLLLTVSWTAAADKWQELMPTLPVTAALYYIAVVIATGHSLLHLVALTWGGPRTWEGHRL
ncbi:MAG: TRAP transporter small permease [Candidatus Competibacterales bacterium]|nr:TRAP transporter small permease [Candidatus Competibacterales bacterium]